MLVYYRIYSTEYGAIPSKTSAAPGDPFLGRIKAISVAPPHTVNAVKLSIEKVEKIRVKDRTSTSLFLTPYSQSPMADAGKITILNLTGPGSTPQEPLALVAKMPVVDFERSTGKARLEPEGTRQRCGWVGGAEALYGSLEPQERGGLTRAQAVEGLFASLEPRGRGGLTRAQAAEASYAPLGPGGRGELVRAAEALYSPWEPQKRGGLMSAADSKALYTHNAPSEPEGRGGLARAAEAHWEAESLYAHSNTPLEPEERGGLASAGEPDTMHAEIRYRTSIQNFPTFLFITS